MTTAGGRREHWQHRRGGVCPLAGALPGGGGVLSRGTGHAAAVSGARGRDFHFAHMYAYRDGKREDAMMSSFASGLSDDDIENLATYYSGLK